MEQLIERIDRELIKAELTPDKFLRKTNKAGNEIYVTTSAESPNIMREIGRIRELAFRLPGGGTGKSCDIDEFDLMEKPYKQLFVWDPQNEEIIGGYRFINGPDMSYDDKGQPLLATSEIVHFSDRFIKDYIPTTLELGRSFVHPDYQATKMGAKSIFALDNLWDGLGALCVETPNLDYLFGKVTIYSTYNSKARDLILSYLSKHYQSDPSLIYPYEPLPVDITVEQRDALFKTGDVKEDYKILNKAVRELGVDVPPLVNAYLGLSSNISYFGAAVCHSFGEVIEFSILIPFDSIYPQKKSRHIDSYKAELEERARTE